MMFNDKQRINDVPIEEEMKSSYLDYSMSVIVQRALPDVRDGLKPVHRRILFGMQDLNLQPNKPYKKSARIVGDVIGKYHPHGDSAVYDSLVRMVQDFSLRYPLVDGQGNFGSVDGDSAAAYRYTEARMSKVATELLSDIDKQTVDFVANYDESLKEPTVLPAAIPNLLVNGTSGIAVGMATNFAPHNLREVIAGTKHFLDNPQATPDDLMKFVRAPDFPTAGIIYGYKGVQDAYRTGLGRVVVRARATIETGRGGKDRIVITELPYQVNKLRLIEKIVEQVKLRKLEGLSDIRDESDRDGMRLILELKRDVVAKVVLNYLFKHTQMQVTFGVNMLALVNNQPKLLTLRDVIYHYIEHRLEVIVRRTRFELNKAEARAHILEGLQIALDNIDKVISIIRNSQTPDTARLALMDGFELSELQAKAILEMRLQKLTGLEREKLDAELRELNRLIREMKKILASEELQKNIIKEELDELDKKYGDERRTELLPEESEFTIEDMIAEEDVVITISRDGFIKRFPVSGFKKQNRGGRGITGATTKEEDIISSLFIGSTHDYIMFFTTNGRVYWLKVHEIPHAGRAAKGRAIVNLLEKPRDEKVTSVLIVKDFDETKHVMMATRLGVIKKVSLEQFSRPRRAGIRAIELKESDSLIDVHLTDGEHEIIVATREGKAVRFKESDVRQMGRTAAGVRSVSLAGPDDFVVGMVTTPSEEHSLLVLSEKGYGKRSQVKDYRLTKRGTKGVLTIKVSEKTGPLVGIKLVTDSHDLLIITSKGVLIRQPIEQIRVMGRATQGVRLIRMDDGDSIGDLAVVQLEESVKVDSTTEDTPEETVVEKPTENSNTTETDLPSNPDDEEQGELFNS